MTPIEFYARIEEKRGSQTYAGYLKGLGFTDREAVQMRDCRFKKRLPPVRFILALERLFTPLEMVGLLEQKKETMSGPLLRDEELIAAYLRRPKMRDVFEAYRRIKREQALFKDLEVNGGMR